MPTSFNLIVNAGDEVSSRKDTTDLKNWIQREQVKDLKIKQEEGTVKPDEASAALLLSILNVSLGSAGIKAFVESLFNWLGVRSQARTKEFHVVLDLGEKGKIAIDSKNANKDEITDILSKALTSQTPPHA